MRLMRLMRPRKQEKGFTFTEMMMMSVIVGLLSAAAFASYQSQIKKTRSADAMSDLVKLMQQQERFFQNNQTYTTDLADLGEASASIQSDQSYYNIAAGLCSGGLSIERCVQITASPVGDQAGEPWMSLNSRGVRDSAVGESAWN